MISEAIRGLGQVDWKGFSDFDTSGWASVGHDLQERVAELVGEIDLSPVLNAAGAASDVVVTYWVIKSKVQCVKFVADHVASAVTGCPLDRGDEKVLKKINLVLDTAFYIAEVVAVGPISNGLDAARSVVSFAGKVTSYPEELRKAQKKGHLKVLGKTVEVVYGGVKMTAKTVKFVAPYVATVQPALPYLKFVSSGFLYVSITLFLIDLGASQYKAYKLRAGAAAA